MARYARHHWRPRGLPTAALALALLGAAIPGSSEPAHAPAPIVAHRPHTAASSTGVVAAAADPLGGGLWTTTGAGAVGALGVAPNDGGVGLFGLTGLSGSRPLAAPIVGIAPTPDGRGYWLVAADGGVFTFGDAGFYGNTYTLGLTGLSGSRPLAAPIVGIAPTPDGRGYWLVAGNGETWSFGSAPQEGAVAIAASPLANPSANLLPNPDYPTICADAIAAGAPPDNATCENAAIAAIDNAHAAEGIAPLSLPPNFDALPPTAQLTILLDEERTERGLAPLAGVDGTLSQLAAQGAAANADPPLATVFSSGPWSVLANANWAADYATAASVYDWMYADGWGGPGATSNVACTSPSAPGCWGHRDNILASAPGSYAPVLGVASQPEPAGSGWFGLESDATVITFAPTGTLGSLGLVDQPPSLGI